MTQHKIAHEGKLEPTYHRVVSKLACARLYVAIIFPCSNPSVRAVKIHLSLAWGNRTLPASPSSVDDKTVCDKENS